MNELFRNTMSPLGWAAVAAVPPVIVALYFLKLRRVPLEVPSTYLWHKSIEDLRVNSLWQRLRRSVLLLLQLLLAAIAILALLRPGWQGTELTGGRLIFLVDVSASMATADAEHEGEADLTRLDAAKRHVAGLIDQMRRGMTAMLIAYSDEATVVQEFTDNGRLLREGLATLEPTAGGTDLRDALELAGGLANPAQVSVQEGAPEVDVVPPDPATLFVFSDGRQADVDGFALGNLDPVYVPLGKPETGNVAITALETRPSEGVLGELRVFVQAANYTDEAIDAVVELTRGERLLDARRLAIPPGETAGVTASAGEVDPEAGGGSIVARLTEATRESAADRLAIDDVAYAAVNEPSGARVLLVTTGNAPLVQALATTRASRLGDVVVETPAFLETDNYRTLAAGGSYNLVVFDRCQPEVSPRSNTVYLGRLPPGDRWLGGSAAEAGDDAASDGEPAIDDRDDANRWVTVPQIIDWNRAHPLLAHAELGDFDIVESLRLTPPAGSATLIDAAEGPIAAIAGRDGYEDVVLGFPILVEVDGALQRNTDWINRHSFPTFWLNVVEYFIAQQAVGERSVRPREPVELRGESPAADALTVETPSGTRHTLARRGDQPFVFRLTDEVGLYRILESGRETRRFAVNLFDPAESDVRLRTAEDADVDGSPASVRGLKIGNTEVAATAGATPARKELWRPLLVVALGLLALEWWVYHRRVAL